MEISPVIITSFTDMLIVMVLRFLDVLEANAKRRCFVALSAISSSSECIPTILNQKIIARGFAKFHQTGLIRAANLV